MAVFSDRTIRQSIEQGQIKISPYDQNLVQPSSLDIRLGDNFQIFRNYTVAIIDPRKPVKDITEKIVMDNNGIIIHPGEFILGTSLEMIELADNVVARVEGKSSLGRLGLLIHATAGYIDPGFRGQITLEMSNVSKLPIRLYPNMKIGQLSFDNTTTPVDRPYGSAGLGSKYQDQVGATVSRVQETIS